MMTKNFRNLAASSLVAIAAMTAPIQNVSAATGSTDVTINFPNIVILHYFSAITISFTGDVDEAVDQGVGGPFTSAFAPAATFDAALTPAGGTTVTDTVDVTVQNVWAVRGISTSGDINVAGTIDTADATNGGSTATMSNLAVDDGTSSGATIAVPSPGFALANAVVGDVTFDLDVSGVTTAQPHTGMRYTITATAP